MALINDKIQIILLNEHNDKSHLSFPSDINLQQENVAKVSEYN
jgi:hypothetical protein